MWSQVLERDPGTYGKRDFKFGGRIDLQFAAMPRAAYRQITLARVSTSSKSVLLIMIDCVMTAFVVSFPSYYSTRQFQNSGS